MGVEKIKRAPTTTKIEMAGTCGENG